MRFILIDTSVWIEYFRGSEAVNPVIVDNLIENNQICTNDLILSELIPSLKIKREREVIDILLTIRKIPIQIKWNEIIDFQFNNLKNGINNVGIPDLIILQNVIGNDLELFTHDRHFQLMNKYFKFKLFDFSAVKI